MIKKGNKIILITSIVIASIVILLTIFGLVDYNRTLNGKKPIFIYRTVDVTDIDITMIGFEDTALSNKNGATYYGIGYNVSICDKDTKNYTFQLGYKQKGSCYTKLTCTADEKGTLVVNDDSTVSYDENDKDNYEYTFFDGKLERVMATLIRPISSVENVETLSIEIKQLYDNIPGCAGIGKKISEDAYQTIVACNIGKMSSDNIDKYLLIRNKELLEYTRDEIIAYHHNDLTCE